MTAEELRLVIVLYVIVFLYGIVIGSFLNVCILRVPLRESIAKERSHCMSCGYTLAWYDLVPLFSYLFLGGKCRKCKEHISAQYPIVEGLNGIFYVLIFIIYGWSIESMIYCLFTSALLVLCVIDHRAHEVPRGVNVFSLALGLINLGSHLGDWVSLSIGLLAASILACIGMALTKGAWLNRDEVCMLSLAGFLLGWQKTLIMAVGGMIIWTAAFLIGRKRGRRITEIGSCMAAAAYAALLIGRFVFV